MKAPLALSISDYTYFLPEEKIAIYPLPERDASRLLVYEQGKITEDRYANIASLLPANSMLVFNDTKVIAARLLFRKPSGGTIEIFCLEPHEQYPDISTAMMQKGNVMWQCLVGGASKWKPGQVLEKIIATNRAEITLNCRYIEKRAGSFIVELSWTPASLTFAEILHEAGAIPLPPYLKRNAEAPDSERYQTVYAKQEGSVAAPTAGLHFTAPVFKQLAEKNIATAYLTLHVGAGTFKPVKSETIGDHMIHAEWIDVSRDTIHAILNKIEDKIIAVGTTSMRTIESLYWMGVKSTTNSNPGVDGQSLALNQWEAYELAEINMPAGEALRSLLDWMDKNRIERLISRTKLLIAPGYVFRVADGLITNFHQPQSTLLLLVAAFTGADWRKIYDHALENNFRFLSYGDGCLLWKNAAMT